MTKNGRSKGSLNKDLDRIKAKGLNRLFLKSVLQPEQRMTFGKAGNELPLMTKGKRADRVAL